MLQQLGRDTVEAPVWTVSGSRGPATGPFAAFVRTRDRCWSRVADGPIGPPRRIQRFLLLPPGRQVHMPFAMSIALCNGASQPSRIAETENGAPTSGATPLPSRKVPFHV